MRWEYITVQLEQHYPDVLNMYGKDGWELVSVVYFHYEFQTVAFFKRALAESTEDAGNND